MWLGLMEDPDDPDDPDDRPPPNPRAFVTYTEDDVPRIAKKHKFVYSVWAHLGNCEHPYGFWDPHYVIKKSILSKLHDLLRADSDRK